MDSPLCVHIILFMQRVHKNCRKARATITLCATEVSLKKKVGNRSYLAVFFYHTIKHALRPEHRTRYPFLQWNDLQHVILSELCSSVLLFCPYSSENKALHSHLILTGQAARVSLAVFVAVNFVKRHFDRSILSQNLLIAAVINCPILALFEKIFQMKFSHII